MTANPAEIPVIRPDNEPAVATEGEPLTHIPPTTGLLNTAVVPTQTVDGPITGEGSGLIVTTRDIKQPVGKV
jgi:hypothetical protein